MYLESCHSCTSREISHLCSQCTADICQGMTEDVMLADCLQACVSIKLRTGKEIGRDVVAGNSDCPVQLAVDLN